MKKKTKNILRLSIIGAAVLAVAGGVTIGLEANGSNLDLLSKREKIIDDDGSGLDGKYYDWKCKNQDEALKNAQDVTQKTAEEGMVLLKNDDKALPLSTSDNKITILGYYSWHNNMSGGEDPATTSGAISIGKGLANAFKTNEAVTALYDKARGDFADPAASLSSAESTFNTYSTAVITFKINSGEGNDQSRDLGADENHRTGVTITKEELALVDYASKHFKKVIIVINSANSMEVGWLNSRNLDENGLYTDPYDTTKKYDFSKVKAAIWAGACGSQGGTALANILSGKVNPSGHLADTMVKDAKQDPTYQNFGSYVYEDSSSLNSYQGQTFFVEYEEGIYVGYRYYETAAYEASQSNYTGFDYDSQVIYPFGYGLSYTNFKMTYEGTPTYDEKTGNFSFKVNVTNTGDVAGKQVAQIYVNAPYASGDVEKSHVVLGGFAKTKLLDPKESETLDITINQDYFTSYDYKTEKAYILDKGDYHFILSDNAHSWSNIKNSDTTKVYTWNLDSKKVFSEAKDGKRVTDKKVATNVEDDELNFHFKAYNEGSTGDGYAHEMTRANFKASYPTSPTGNDFKFPSDERARKQVAKYDVWANENNEITEMPETNTDKTSYKLADMRGVDFNDEKWKDYMNQFTVDTMAQMFSNGGWNELADDENGVPLSYDADSPYGYYAHALTIKNVNKWYCGDVMVAATWNVDLAKEIGDAFGEESHANLLAGGSLITGLYGYGCNTHRSAFGGRNYEYYSEDPLLAGKMAAAEASGASEKGLITFMKHFVLNEQETNRQLNGYCAWVNEQAFREIYLKPWEIYAKEAKMNVKYYAKDDEGKYVLSSKEMPAATGVMTSYNRVGANWAGASNCINTFLRGECGFTGTIVTDAGGQPNTYMTTDYMLRRGGNLTLANNGTNGLYDTESATAVYWLKNSTQYLLYNKANANIMDGIAPGASFHYSTAGWRIALRTVWIVLGVLALADAVVCCLIGFNVIKTKEAEKKEESSEKDSGDEF